MAISAFLKIKSYRPLMTEKNKVHLSKDGYLTFRHEHNLLKLSDNENDLAVHGNKKDEHTAYSLILPDMNLHSLHVRWFEDDAEVHLSPLEAFVQAYGALEGYQVFYREIHRPARKAGEYGVTFNIELKVDIFTGFVTATCTSSNPLIVPLGFKLDVNPRFMF